MSFEKRLRRRPTGVMSKKDIGQWMILRKTRSWSLVDARNVTYTTTHPRRDAVATLSLIDWARFNVPPNTSQVISGTGFYGLNVNVNVNKQYLFMCKSCNKGYDGCAMRVVFSKLQNCPGFNYGDFRDGGSAFQHMGPETAKARDLTNSVKALKEDRVLSIRLQSHQVNPTTLTIMQRLCSMKKNTQNTHR